MPDPKTLKVGDRVRFVSLPEEWSTPGWTTHKETLDFMKAVIARGRSRRIQKVDADGIPRIEARLREGRGRKRIMYHYWGITEHTGWRRVDPRKRRN